MKTPLLLLTACVNPNGMKFTALQDPKIRMTQYVKAINFYLSKTDFPVLVVENSGYDLATHISTPPNRRDLSA